MTGPEYFSLEASGRPMLVIGRSYFYPRGLPSLYLVAIWFLDRGGVSEIFFTDPGTALMLRFTNDPPNIALLTDENDGCNYVGVRVLVSHGNVFYFFLALIYRPVAQNGYQKKGHIFNSRKLHRKPPKVKSPR